MAAALKSNIDVVTMADIKQTTVRNRYIPVAETVGIFCNRKINQMLQIDLKLVIQTPLHAVILLNAD